MASVPNLRGLLADTRPLRVAAFRRLWIAQAITVVGAQLTVVTVPAQIYGITQSSAFVGLTGIFGLVPLVVFGLYGGALADAFDRRRLLMISTAGLIVTSFCFFAQAFLQLNNVWLLLGLFAVQQMFFALNSPARQAILPALLPGELLTSANALSTTVMQAGAIAGPLIGGALIPLLGYSWLYLVDAITLLATAWAVIKLPSLPPTRSGRSAAQRPGIRSVIAGFAYLAGNKILLMSFAVDIIAMTFGMPRALFPELAHEQFGGPLAGGWVFALLYAAIPIGAVLGGVFSGWVSRVHRHGRAVVIAISVWGGGVVVFGLACWFAGGVAWPFALFAVVGLAIGGAADMISSSFRGTMLLQAADDDVRGRLQGVFLVVVVGGPRIADVLHGGAAAVIGAPATATLGGVVVIVGMVICALAVPAFVRYRPPAPGAVERDAPREPGQPVDEKS